ncbi:heparinase II/III domain-containing protein [Glaciecola petra]|uniref:Heparinase II/III family protein n=1 Tax=Glaciecola petra TaxID=3075602 RepID=A0ABU2ZTQ8_9ALTE|nr:heparinase II/III family protein [Aestuariibacter sp. P117]MDT0595704.1 heparinase II/III family protein [Aestuariibacter sp. P117]
MLLESNEQVEQMQAAATKPGSFSREFENRRSAIDAALMQPINVPLPADAGGGYTHEVHKKNYALIRDAGRLYLLSQEKKYADLIRDILTAYAEMYPSLPLHPKQKEQSPGKLFWQSLNEAMWLVYSIQGYDAVKEALTQSERDKIENGVFLPMVKYLSDESPQTFDKIHNHGTWAVAAVGMAGYVLDKPEWVEKSLYGLDKSGKGGFMRQLDELFSPEGYYNEGPYYQRFALLPFVMFAKAVDVNEPDREIFEYRDGILLKAITTTIELSYNGLFFGINDAIKDKGIDTIELVHGVTVAYNKTGEKGLLSIAKIQNQILLTGDGLEVAQALDEGLEEVYPFTSKAYGDGISGDEGALVVLRQNQSSDHQTLVFKATSQGLGHGHFDKLSWLFFNDGKEIVYDYGAARFLNVEAKYGGHYLAENNSYAKQTIAHNTLVVDEISHFNGNTKEGNKYHPEVIFTEFDERLQVSVANMQNAYKDVTFKRTQAMVNSEEGLIFIVDVLDVNANGEHQLDLPVHFNGQFIDTSVDLAAQTTTQKALGDNNGYQHLWLQALGRVKNNLARVTWLQDSTFYSHSTSVTAEKQVEHDLMMVRVGANDPNFNLIAKQALVNRVKASGNVQFLSVLEVHGEYNGSREYTLDSKSSLVSLENTEVDSNEIVRVFKLDFTNDVSYLLALADDAKAHDQETQFSYMGKTFLIKGNAQLIRL